MTDNELLAMLKVDIGITTTAYDSRLLQYIQTAQAEIEQTGITLTDSVSDGSLIIMYAAWMWRRRDTGEGMPRMLQFTLHGRLVSEKTTDG